MRFLLASFLIASCAYAQSTANNSEKDRIFLTAHLIAPISEFGDSGVRAVIEQFDIARVINQKWDPSLNRWRFSNDSDIYAVQYNRHDWGSSILSEAQADKLLGFESLFTGAASYFKANRIAGVPLFEKPDDLLADYFVTGEPNNYGPRPTPKTLPQTRSVYTIHSSEPNGPKISIDSALSDTSTKQPTRVRLTLTDTSAPDVVTKLIKLGDWSNTWEKPDHQDAHTTSAEFPPKLIHEVTHSVTGTLDQILKKTKLEWKKLDKDGNLVTELITADEFLRRMGEIQYRKALAKLSPLTYEKLKKRSHFDLNGDGKVWRGKGVDVGPLSTDIDLGTLETRPRGSSASIDTKNDPVWLHLKDTEKEVARLSDRNQDGFIAANEGLLNKTDEKLSELNHSLYYKLVQKIMSLAREPGKVWLALEQSGLKLEGAQSSTVATTQPTTQPSESMPH